jgi:hypothetical protein
MTRLGGPGTFTGRNENVEPGENEGRIWLLTPTRTAYLLRLQEAQDTSGFAGERAVTVYLGERFVFANHTTVAVLSHGVV